jgi:hypothetical protein
MLAQAFWFADKSGAPAVSPLCGPLLLAATALYVVQIVTLSPKLYIRADMQVRTRGDYKDKPSRVHLVYIGTEALKVLALLGAAALLLQ